MTDCLAQNGVLYPLTAAGALALPSIVRADENANIYRSTTDMQFGRIGQPGSTYPLAGIENDLGNGGTSDCIFDYNFVGGTAMWIAFTVIGPGTLSTGVSTHPGGIDGPCPSSTTARLRAYRSDGGGGLLDSDSGFGALSVVIPDDGYCAHRVVLDGFNGAFAFGGATWTPDAPPAPPLPPGDEAYEIVPPGDTIAIVGVLVDGYNRAIRAVRNEPGSGTFTINRYSADVNAATIKPGNLVKVKYPQIDPDPIFAWFMEPGDFTLVSSNEEGGEDITIAGRGALSYWDRAIWLSQMFAVQWWDSAWGTPPAGAIGHIDVVAGTYRHYTIAGGVITGYTITTTAAFGAYYDTAKEYQWPSAGIQRFAVHIMTGETHAGWYVHTSQDGVTVVKPTYAIGSTILLSSISADKPGAILYRMFQEATAASRPTKPIPLMTVDFTATTDSNGAAWTTTDALAGVTVQLGETYLETIAKLVATGVIDVEMGPNLDMHAYNAQGRDLTSATFAAGKVRFAKGVNVADELKREQSDVPVGTFIEVAGLDSVVGQATLPDAATRVAREVSATGDSNDTTVLGAMGLADLNARLIRSDAIGFHIATGDDDAAGLYLPGPAGTAHGDFWLGDLVTLHTGTDDQDFDNEDERVYAITISEDEAGNLEVVPEVGSVLGEAERRLYAGLGSTQASFVTRSQFTDTAVAETVLAHGELTGLSADDHPQYATDADLTAHVAVADPHTGYVLESLIDAAGDLYLGTADNTVGRLAKGADSTVLTVDPATHLPIWAVPGTGYTDPLTTRGDLLRRGAATSDRYAIGAAGRALVSDGTDPQWTAQYASFLFVIDGSGSAIATGIKGDLSIPFACVIERARLLADQSGSIVVDVWVDTYANYPPTVADTITAAAKPTLSGATKASDITLTGWTTALAEGSTIRLNVDSVATVTRVLLELKVRRT